MPSTVNARLFALLALPVALAVVLAGCRRKGASGTDEEAESERQTEAQPFLAAFLYEGPKQDGGFNQAHAEGAAAMARKMGIRMLEEENVPPGLASGATFDRVVASRNANVVFATAFDEFGVSLDKARQYPRTAFLHCGGYYQEGQDPANAGTFNGYLDEAYYVAGVVAGMTSKSRRLGFVAGSDSPHALRDINAFALGARSVDPRVTTEVVFTGSWSDAEKEKQAAEGLIAKKVDVLAMYVAAPRVLLETAESHGIYSVGVHLDGSKYAPKGYLTGAEWNWTKIYTDYVTWLRLGKTFPRIVRGGLMEGHVFLSPFGPAVSAEAKQRAADVRAEIAQGKLVIFKGPLSDNAGKRVFAPDMQLIQRDIRLEKMSYLVEGVIGKPPG